MKIRIIVSFIMGVMIGVSGGEFRILMLTYLMSGPMNIVITSNLIIGFLQ